MQTRLRIQKFFWFEPTIFSLHHSYSTDWATNRSRSWGITRLLSGRIIKRSKGRIQFYFDSWHLSSTPRAQKTKIHTGADPGFFLVGGAPLRNDVTDRWGKQILKVNTKKASSQGGGGAHPLHSPPRSASDTIGYITINWTKIKIKNLHGSQYFHPTQ